MEKQTITVRCESFEGVSVDENLTDITLKNMCLSDLLCEFNIDDIAQALVDADKSSEVMSILISNDEDDD